MYTCGKVVIIVKTVYFFHFILVLEFIKIINTYNIQSINLLARATPDCMTQKITKKVFIKISL